MIPEHKHTKLSCKPRWLTQTIHSGTVYKSVLKLLKNERLHSVCQEAHCPNMGECFSRGTATFLILGKNCTRSCRFCAITQAVPEPPEPTEPSRVAETVRSLRLSYVVITSVTRDDLPDGGAEHFAGTISEIRRTCPQTRVEILVPDFNGSEKSIQTIVEARPDVINHNLETVPRLYPTVRPEAQYIRSLKLLKRIQQMVADIPTKSGLMLGLGETSEEILSVLTDLIDINCKIITLGQYLQPTRNHLPVERYIPPEEFENWRKISLEMGFKGVASGPFVRSSYHADELYQAVRSSSGE